MPEEFTPKALLSHYGSHPLVLDMFLLKHLGPGYYSWEPETVWTEVLRAARAPNISVANKNKIQAIRTIHLTDTVFKRWEVFEKIIIALNGIVPSFSLMQCPDPGQLWMGVNLMKGIRDEPFSPEVAAYSAAALLEHGWAYGPEMLSYCNSILAEAHPLHGKVASVVRSGGAGDEEAVALQLAKIKQAKLYVLRAAERLLGQVGVVQ